ncbi:uncharacterized protein BJ171DRAFT_583633 [Polychytrium aggregatum]|uniref:uncharacterized protein n=1 Tax=Polychytrium aggregatum TaxID=110093 RepID=UPI0022FEDB8F|nr:uncharacterized protein BJ171DRAFT_583633 [Polychytrium aggregatum]KAI9202818.1 hypothetical protein BJ171DRAFT_583633 [Polychytrium aggregatum]
MRIFAKVFAFLLSAGFVFGAPMGASSGGILDLILDNTLGPLIAPITGLECGIQAITAVATVCEQCKFNPFDVAGVIIQVVTTLDFSEDSIKSIEGKINKIILGFTNELCADPNCYKTLEAQALAVYDKCSKLVEEFVPEIVGIDDAVFKSLLPTLLLPDHNPLCIKDPSTNCYCGIEILENFEKVMLPSYWQGTFDPNQLSICSSCFDSAILSLGNSTLTQNFNNKCPNVVPIPI